MKEKRRRDILGVPISDIHPTNPPQLDRTIRTCLAKQADARFQTVHDLGLQLKWISEGAVQINHGTGRASRNRPWILAACACALLAVAAIGLAAFFSQKTERLRRVVRTQVGAPEHNDFLPLSLFNHNIVSPDGTAIAFIAGNIGTGSTHSLWVRPLSANAAQPLVGTEGAYYPFWSPDSKSIGFFASGKLKKVDVSGGAVQNICDAPIGRGGTWNRDGVILFAPYIRDAIYRVSEAGGQPSVVTRTGGSNLGGRWPYFLPDGRHFLFNQFRGLSDSKVFAASLDSSEVIQVLDQTNVEYANGI